MPQDDEDEIIPLTQTQPFTQSFIRSESQRVGHYSSLNMEEVQVTMEDSVGSGYTMQLSGESPLQEGQQFPNKESVVLAVKNYSIRRGVEYKVYESDQTKYQGKCKHFGSGCNWSIRVTYRRKRGVWEVRKYNGEHTCLARGVSQHNSHLDVDVITSCISSLVEADPMVPIRVLQASVHEKYGFSVSYRKAWLAKQKAIAQIYGDWENSYNELPKWLLGLQSFMPGTFICLLFFLNYLFN